MELEEKLTLLGDQAADDFEETAKRSGTSEQDASSPCGIRPRKGTRMAGITEVSLPGGGSMRLMRVMMTNVCRFSCSYCAIRAGRKMPRASFQPEELANAFISAYQRGFCEGLFVTSAIPGPAPRQMDKMIALMEILRERYGYDGYIHVKILPGSEPAQIERAAQLANRLSLNLEAPSEEGLSSIASEKKLTTDLLPRLRLAGRLSLKAKQDPSSHLTAKAGVTSQFVIGASRDSDRDVLGLVGTLYKEKLLHHAHYAAFQPVVDTPFATRPAVPLLREFRLYQADYLFRLYGFRPDELIFDKGNNILLDYDPKVAWALAHPEKFPVELTRATLDVLMRVPGIGKIAAERIVTWRRTVHFRDELDLQKAGAVMKRARGFLTLNGRRFADHMWEEQKSLWDVKPPTLDHALRTDDPPCAYR